jgi:hypothetical protein
VVGLDSCAPVRLNFGQRPFAFDLAALPQARATNAALLVASRHASSRHASSPRASQKLHATAAPSPMGGCFPSLGRKMRLGEVR